LEITTTKSVILIAKITQKKSWNPGGTDKWLFEKLHTF